MSLDQMELIFTQNNADALKDVLYKLTNKEYKVNLSKKNGDLNMTFFDNDGELIEIHKNTVVNVKNVPMNTLLSFLSIAEKRFDKTNTMINLIVR